MRVALRVRWKHRISISIKVKMKAIGDECDDMRKFPFSEIFRARNHANHPWRWEHIEYGWMEMFCSQVTVDKCKMIRSNHVQLFSGEAQIVGCRDANCHKNCVEELIDVWRMRICVTCENIETRTPTHQIVTKVTETTTTSQSSSFFFETQC